MISQKPRLDEVVDAGGDDGDGGAAVGGGAVADDGAERGEIEVVHVSVGEQDGVDGREVARCGIRGGADGGGG